MKRIFIFLVFSVYVFTVKAQCPSNSEDFPIIADTYDSYSWSAGLYSISQVGGAGTITTLTIRLDNPYSPSETYNNQSIYFRHTTATDYGSSSSYPSTSGFTLVWSGTINFNSNGYYNITLTTPFNYNGSDNLEVLWLNKRGSSSYDDLWFDRTDASASLHNGKRGGGYSWSNATSDCSTFRYNTAFGFNTTNNVNCSNFETTLPIELAEFSAKQINNNVQLEWKTTSEINNSFFTIETSCDGENFKSLSKINGAINSSSVKNYTYVDKTVKDGINYYRLKQTDLDGKYTYSKIISISKKQTFDNKVSIIYNAVNDNLKLLGENLTQVKISDITGKVIYNNKINSKAEYTINTQEISKGIYFAVIYTNNNVTTKKLLFLKKIIYNKFNLCIIIYRIYKFA